MIGKNETGFAKASKLSPRSRASLADLAHEAISEAIVDRRLAPSARLSIDSLAEELDMSNTPVREALTRLAAERLVIQDSHHRSYTVAPLLTREEYDHLFEFRRLLELNAIELSQFGPDVVQELEAIASQMPYMETGPVYHDYKDFIRADSQFHRVLVGSSRNRFLIEAWDNLHFHLHASRLYAGTGVIDFRQGLEEHRRIIDAVALEDKEAVLRMVKAHIQSAQARLGVLVDASPPME